MSAVLVGCASDNSADQSGTTPFVEVEGGHNGLPADSTLPALYRREGLVSSSTYQVHVVVLAESPDEARLVGDTPARQRAIDLMQNERAISSRIGYYGRQEIKRLVEEEGEIVRVHHEKDATYVIVLQVYRAGLYHYLQKLH